MAVINPANPIRRTGSGGNGASAYEIAVENGFNGTEQEWLESLIGPPGADGENGANGKSAYEIAVENGFVGTEQEWLESLVGPEGRQGDPGINGKDGEDGAIGPVGPIGPDGKSAYDIAVENGFEGNVLDWLASLKGADGEDGAPGEQGIQGIPGVDGPQGIQGEQGPPFSIAKIYPSIDEMNADFGSSDVAIGQFVLIDTGDVEDEDNAKLFVKTPIKFSFITDLSGAQGIQGPQGIQGIQGQQGEQGEQGLQGIPGADGQNGISPTVSITEIDSGHRVTITDADGTYAFDVLDGSSGMSDFPTIRDTAIDNVSFLDKSVNPDLPFIIPCCIRLINSSLGYTFNDDIVHVSRDIDGKLIVTTLDNAVVMFNVDETTGGLELAMSDRLVNRLALIEEDIEALQDAVENLDNTGGTTIVSGGGLLFRQATLLASGWDENGEQTVTVDGILADDTKQLITTVPAESSFNDYYTADIKSIAHSTNAITFRYYDTQPTTDCVVNVFIGSVSEPDNYIWWSPEMTSSNAPSPYAVTSSGDYVPNNPSVAGYRYAWYALDDSLDTFWCSTNVSGSWITFDFGKSVSIKGIKLLPGASGSTDSFPKKLAILGSNNNSNFDIIYQRSGALATPENGVYYEFMLEDLTVSYRYYKILATDSTFAGSANWFCISDMRFYLKESEVTSV